MDELFERLAKAMKGLFAGKVSQEEDPVKLAEQNILALKKDLGESLRSLTEVKALYIRTKRENEAQQKMALGYEQKAVQLLEKARDGQLAQIEADRLAALALAKKQEIMGRVTSGEKGLKNYEAMLRQMEASTLKLKSQVETWENELRTLKARARVSEATKSLHEKLNRTDTQSTLNLLDNLRDKVAEQEALAESYTAIANNQTQLDDEINRVLGIQANAPVNQELQQLKAKVSTPLPPAVHQSTNPPDSLLAELERLKAKLKE